ncbi:SpaH/EbpB family LPXTG-anchored major pilin [Enterococcus gallinarum]|uniref:SpaH/EbpB family LPXTG-anchored major pilin n=1 Tax=Enterococcus gallinarum TaxID=1353 RepID=UPI0012E17BF6|nr:SpaH/EbpB family LPXTG-anchored major pilin [Enterococcus gallinarum]MUO33849.1 SpaH/EbpB family LPXTG-anchored major pilin [Enterococcus gallinarum]
MKRKKKLVTKFVVATTLFTAGSLVVPAVGTLSAYAATTGPVADNTSPRSITLWKYQVKDLSELGDRGDGEMDDTVTKTPLAGIKFRIQRVTAIGDAALTNPLDQKEGTDYTIDNSFTAQTVTTGADGSVKANLGTGNVADGIYLVTELEDDRGVSPTVAKPADPFFVQVPQTDRDDLGSLIYDVVVQPKNIMESLLEPDKTVEEGKGFSNKAGNHFTWEANATLPSGLYQIAAKDMVITPVYDKDGNQIADIPVSAGDEIYADYYTIRDTLNEKILLDGLTVNTKTDTGDWAALEFGADYTVTLNGSAVTAQPVTDQSENAKAVAVSLTEAGMKKVATNGDTKIQVVFETHTDKDFNGTIVNHMDVDYLSPGLKPVEVPSPPEEDPEYYTGGFDIKKTAEDEAKLLAGAEFHLATSEEDAKANKFLASDGKSYTLNNDGSVTGMPNGVTLLKATSDAQGLAEFNGLALNWYTDTDGDGQQDIGTEPTFDADDIKRDYWVVETKAPDGYELLKAPQQITVNLASETNDIIEARIINETKTDLPFTGGAGTTLLIAIAIGAITIGTAAVVIDKKRQTN